jgi:hypothetical protein
MRLSFGGPTVQFNWEVWAPPVVLQKRNGGAAAAASFRQKYLAIEFDFVTAMGARHDRIGNTQNRYP